MTHAETTRAALEDALATGQIVRVVLRLVIPGVDVPEHLRHLPWLALELCVRGFEANDDFEATAEGFSVTLRFGAEYYRCVVPWGAVVSVDHREHKPGPRWTATVIQGGKAS